MAHFLRTPMLAACAALLGFSALAQAQNPFNVANEACWQAVVREARGRMAADGVEQISNPDMRQASNAENVLTGTGMADGRPFSYSCTYNIRNGSTYDVRISAARETGRYNDRRDERRDERRYDRAGLPDWMIGEFEAFNRRADAEISLHIHEDGRVSGRVNGTRISGVVRGNVLEAEGARYTLEEERNGFSTRQIGRPDNVVRYRRK